MRAGVAVRIPGNKLAEREKPRAQTIPEGVSALKYSRHPERLKIFG